MNEHFEAHHTTSVWVGAKQWSGDDYRLSAVRVHTEHDHGGVSIIIAPGVYLVGTPDEQIRFAERIRQVAAAHGAKVEVALAAPDPTRTPRFTADPATGKPLEAPT